jgi:hypothetical protein
MEEDRKLNSEKENYKEMKPEEVPFKSKVHVIVMDDF